MTVSTKHYVAVNLGSGPNTGTGDDLLTAFNKINQNFGNYESVGFPTGDISASGTVQAAYFIGDGSQITNLPTSGLYSNANVASYLPTYSGNIANVTITGNVTLVNPLTVLAVSGAISESGYQQYKPTANIAVTANVNVRRVLLNPVGTVVSFGANVTLPNNVVDGTMMSITSNIAVSQLAVTAPWITSVSPFGNITLSAGSGATYLYVSADKIWYKVA
jgi:hypothetical protein